jgi:hypothetical protein
MKHRTGYHVWLYGERWWHRTLDGAIRRASRALGYCSGEHNQIINVATGQQVSW